MGLVLTTPLSQRKPVSGRVSDQRVITCASCASNPHDIRPLTPAALPAYPPNRPPPVSRCTPAPSPNLEAPATGDSTMSQIWTGYTDVTNCTGISYGNAKNRESCVSPLTTAKLTRSCADPNPGAIMYTQFTMDIALKGNGRCNKLALEHHKVNKNANLGGSQCRLSCQALRHSCKGLEQKFTKGGLRACAGAYPLAY